MRGWLSEDAAGRAGRAPRDRGGGGRARARMLRCCGGEHGWRPGWRSPPRARGDHYANAQEFLDAGPVGGGGGAAGCRATGRGGGPAEPAAAGNPGRRRGTARGRTSPARRPWSLARTPEAAAAPTPGGGGRRQAACRQRADVEHPDLALLTAVEANHLDREAGNLRRAADAARAAAGRSHPFPDAGAVLVQRCRGGRPQGLRRGERRSSCMRWTPRPVTCSGSRSDWRLRWWGSTPCPTATCWPCRSFPRTSR